jgi:hypothetical protein
MSSPKRLKWGDLSGPRPSTNAYRDGMDKVCKEGDKKRARKQKRLAAAARLKKARTCVKVYGEGASAEAKKLVKRYGMK